MIVGGGLGLFGGPAGVAAGLAIGGAAGGWIGGAVGGKSGAKKGKSAGQKKAQRQAARGFQKDWRAKKKRQVAAERGARADLEGANLLAKMQDDDQMLASSMREAPVTGGGKGQFERFEQRNFG
jgi:hypothetical protein